LQNYEDQNLKPSSPVSDYEADLIESGAELRPQKVKRNVLSQIPDKFHQI